MKNKKNKFTFFTKVNLFFLLVFSFLIHSQTKYVEEIFQTDEKLKMVFIPAGSFLMGSSRSENGHFGDEGPQHEVSVNAFWMSQYEITWNLYNLFVTREIDKYQKNIDNQNEVSIDVDAISGATTPYVEMSFGMGIDDFPAISMTQLAAARFCQWLSAMTGNFYRLPTEAEWEYACRAGTKTAYSFGNNLEDLEDYAWYESNSENKYHKVGQKLPNLWGLYDMHGNVSEWTLDQYSATTFRKRKGNEVNNPYVIPSKKYPRVVRGGSWMDSPKRTRSASRRPSSKEWKRQDPQIPKSLWWHTDAQFLGFRVVRPLKIPSEELQKKYWGY